MGHIKLSPVPGIGPGAWQRVESRAGALEGLGDRTALSPVLQCRELYYCVKDSMERAAARQQSIKPGEKGRTPRARPSVCFHPSSECQSLTRRSGMGFPTSPIS